MWFLMNREELIKNPQLGRSSLIYSFSTEDMRLAFCHFWLKDAHYGKVSNSIRV